MSMLHALKALFFGDASLSGIQRFRNARKGS